MMRVETVVVGPIQTNCYLVSSDDELVVVDPGDDAALILQRMGGRKPSCIVCTHGHWDHVGAVSQLQALTGAGLTLCVHDAGRVDGVAAMGEHDIARGYGAPAVSRRLAQGDEVKVGSCTFSVIETPGHTPGSICLYCAEEQVMISGDTLFAQGSYGRTDFEGGSLASMRQSLAKLSALPDEVAVLPGHGPSSTIGVERRLNPYMLAR